MKKYSSRAPKYRLENVNISPFKAKDWTNSKKKGISKISTIWPKYKLTECPSTTIRYKD